MFLSCKETEGVVKNNKVKVKGDKVAVDAGSKHCSDEIKYTVQENV